MQSPTAARHAAIALVISGCASAPHTPEPATKMAAPTVDLIRTELAAYAAARPVFERWCVRCHTPSGGWKAMAVVTSETFDISRYPFGGVHGKDAGYVVAAALGEAFTDLDQSESSWATKPGPARMPRTQPGVVKGEELERILAWARAWREAERAGKHVQSLDR